MFEDAIMELEAMGVDYTESEDGTLTIQIESVDKTDLITIISFLNDNGLDYTIDATTIVVMGGDIMEPDEDAELDDTGMAFEDLGLGM